MRLWKQGQNQRKNNYEKGLMIILKFMAIYNTISRENVLKLTFAKYIFEVQTAIK